MPAGAFSPDTDLTATSGARSGASGFSTGNFGDFVVGAPKASLAGAVLPVAIVGAVAWLIVTLIKNR